MPNTQGTSNFFCILASTLRVLNGLAKYHGAGRHIWAQLLTKLQLSADQQEQMLAARRRLLKNLDAIGQTRWEIIVQLGQAALELGKVRCLRTCH